MTWDVIEHHKIQLKQQSSTALGQAVVYVPVTQRAHVRSLIETSFLGEVFLGFFLICKTDVRKLYAPRSPNIIWPSLSSPLIIHYECQWPEMLVRPKTSNIHTHKTTIKKHQDTWDWHCSFTIHIRERTMAAIQSINKLSRLPLQITVKLFESNVIPIARYGIDIFEITSLPGSQWQLLGYLYGGSMN